MYRIVETDNFGRDYPNETFVNLYPMTKDHADSVVRAINNGFPMDYPRYWKVVDQDYKLCPAFEP